MSIDFNCEFKELDGTVIPERPDEVEEVGGKEVKKKSPPFTLRTACVNVLLNLEIGEIVCPQCKNQIKVPEELGGEERVRRFKLATRIYESKGLIDVGTKDIELLKDLIVKTYPSNLIVGQAWEVLDRHGVEEIGEEKK